MKLDYKKATFLLGVAGLSQLPPDQGVEVAFAGRSNAGKSSVLNRLTGNARLARVSRTPGRTQQINIFTLDDERRLADLPGYGYAKVPPAVKEKWQHLLGQYFETRQSLRGCVLVMDIRHPLKPFDCDLLEWAGHSGLAVHVLLNKADKLTAQHAGKTLQAVTDALTQCPGEMSVQIFSAEKGAGLAALHEKLDAWFVG